MAKDSLKQLREDFKIHAQQDQAALASIAEQLRQIQSRLNPESETYMLRGVESTLKPISDTYETTTKLGKWAMTILVCASLIVGILWGILQIATAKVSVALP